MSRSIGSFEYNKIKTSKMLPSTTHCACRSASSTFSLILESEYSAFQIHEAKQQWDKADWNVRRNKIDISQLDKSSCLLGPTFNVILSSQPHFEAGFTLPGSFNKENLFKATPFFCLGKLCFNERGFISTIHFANLVGPWLHHQYTRRLGHKNIPRSFCRKKWFIQVGLSFGMPSTKIGSTAPHQLRKELHIFSSISLHSFQIGEGQFSTKNLITWELSQAQDQVAPWPVPYLHQWRIPQWNLWQM